MKKRLTFVLCALILGGLTFIACNEVKKEAPQNEKVELSPELREELKNLIIHENRRSPFDLGTFGEVKHMALKGQHMRMFVEINPYFYRIDKIRTQPEIIKRSLMDNLSTMTDELNPLLAKLGENQVGLRVELGSENTDGIMEIYFSPKELIQMSQTQEKDLDPRQMLVNHAAAYQVSLPSEMERFHAKLTAVDVTSEYMQYTFHLAEPEGNEMHRLRSGKMVWGKKILDSLHHPEYSSIGKVVWLCRKAHLGVSYRFIGEDSGLQVTIFFDLAKA